ncbi:NAD(P)-binding domain protein [Akanthomyces lecanii RCEF 1005]|uniref:NAD(P)-binding domain protein n=1 Tax=Akanthomyces lecanii RCEF 1005 TaxID=1081108 RepID=A0A168FU67_CORDF|nr:NAD(P)-binding domain protein [Akanthomyces lecanii RCEF 1005]
MADTLSLAGKVALITGSGRTGGIGAAIARTFAKNGASVIIHYASNSSKESALKISASIEADFKVKSTVVCGRVDQQETGRDIVAQALADLKTSHIDILNDFNNAGGAGHKPLLETTADDFTGIFGANVFGATYLTQAVVTDLTRELWIKEDGTSSEMAQGINARTKAEPRLGELQDMADAALLLVSERSRWITAQWIAVSGGTYQITWKDHCFNS